jgi:hypothetical protein
LLGSNGLGRVLAVHLEVTCYCNEHLTDGRIDNSIAKLLESDRDPIQVLRVFARSSIRLAIKVKGGFQLHDYDEYQPSKREVQEGRKKERDRKRKARLRPESVPAGHQVVSGVPIRSDTTEPSRPDQDQDPALRAASFPQPVEKPNVQVLTALAKDRFDTGLFSLNAAEHDLADELKQAAALAGLVYDGRSITKALDSARAQILGAS